MSFRPRLALRSVLLASSMTLAGGGPALAQDEPPAEFAATQLRVSLNRTLAEHAFLSVEVVRSVAAASPALTAAASALDANTSQLVALMESVYGAEAAAAFGTQWRHHIGYLVDYARALADGDADAAQLAAQQLDRYVSDFSRFLAQVVPALPADAVEGLIEEHVQQLKHVAAFAEADFGDAYPAIRATYRHVFMVGDALAVGIADRFPDRFGGGATAFSPATDVRITLDRLLGEHTFLAALAMRARLNEAPDADSAVQALNANAAELAETIAQIYGAKAGAAFASIWEGHTMAYLGYVDAVLAGEDDQAEGALAELREYAIRFSAFVAAANPLLSEGPLEALMATHTDHLVIQADASAAGDYEAVFQIGREAYAHSAVLSATLAAAIADQFPRLYPDTALPTDRRSALVTTGMVLLGLSVMVRVGWPCASRVGDCGVRDAIPKWRGRGE